ncbi:MAG: transposase [Verrucomicrobiales bacterium]|nr:transposase [Verrucomicrobiales bacterium]
MRPASRGCAGSVRRREHLELPAQGDTALTNIKVSLPRWLNGFAHPISNVLAEGFNRFIQAIKSAARGFRNLTHNRVRILFLLGKRDFSLP